MSWRSLHVWPLLWWDTWLYLMAIGGFTAGLCHCSVQRDCPQNPALTLMFHAFCAIGSLVNIPARLFCHPPQSSFCFKHVSENLNASHISKWGDPLGDHLFKVMADSVVFPMAEILVFVLPRKHISLPYSS